MKWFLIGAAVGFLAGWRACSWWFPALLGRMETWALRGKIRQYRRRRR